MLPILQPRSVLSLFLSHSRESEYAPFIWRLSNCFVRSRESRVDAPVTINPSQTQFRAAHRVRSPIYRVAFAERSLSRNERGSTWQEAGND